MYNNLQELKEAFYSDENLTSKEVFMYMENIILGTSNYRNYIAYYVQFHGLVKENCKVSNEEIYRRKIGNGGHQESGGKGGMYDTYPWLKGCSTIVSYGESATPQDWDISYIVLPLSGNILLPSIFIYLDGNWKRRCEEGDSVELATDQEATMIKKGLRLNDV